MLKMLGFTVKGEVKMDIKEELADSTSHSNREA